ncbi:MAG: fibronectin type III domain-containing protein [Coriobacteriia bacterium]|nr:fibronectin type III domain-containing protein [Coriobacteriia bacterium]
MGTRARERGLSILACLALAFALALALTGTAYAADENAETKYIDKISLSFTTDKACAGLKEGDLFRELRNASLADGTEETARIKDVVLYAYTEPNLGGTYDQIGSSAVTTAIDPKRHYYALFQVEANRSAGYDFKHEGNDFDTSSVTWTANGKPADGTVNQYYNEYLGAVSIYVPIEITCDHKSTTTHIENQTQATTTKDGAYDKVTCCDACDKELARTHVTIPRASTISLAGTSFTYTGKAFAPAVTVKDSKSKTLTKGTDYTVSYASGRTAVGSYAVKVSLKGNYSGEKQLSFNVVPKKASVKKLSAKKKSLTVTMGAKPTATAGTGYQVAYKQKGTSKWKTVNTSKQTTKIKKLKKGKKYYVKARAYKKVGNATYYGAYSKAKLSKKVK